MQTRKEMRDDENVYPKGYEFAKGGLSEHGLKTGDKIVGKSGTKGVKIYNKKSREAGAVNLNSGKRVVNKYAKGGDC